MATTEAVYKLIFSEQINLVKYAAILFLSDMNSKKILWRILTEHSSEENPTNPVKNFPPKVI
ncbi:MAG: hypothetical protein K2O91_27395, partial [Lachnospiraceae bacterium]|nr:hypothetical protein [Lachnospiraceae bacterium]